MRTCIALLILLAVAFPASPQKLNSPAPPAGFFGVYESIANNRVLPGRLKNSGSPNDAPLLPRRLKRQRRSILKTIPGDVSAHWRVSNERARAHEVRIGSSHWHDRNDV